MCERWVGDWTNCSILTHSFFVFSSTSFSFYWAAQSWVQRTHRPLLGTGSRLQLTQPYVAPAYIIVWLPPALCECHICTEFNPSTVKAISWCLWTDAPVPWLTTGSKVNMLHLSRIISSLFGRQLHPFFSGVKSPRRNVLRLWFLSV